MLCMFIYVLCIAMRALYRTLAKVYIELNLNLNRAQLSLQIYMGNSISYNTSSAIQVTLRVADVVRVSL